MGRLVSESQAVEGLLEESAREKLPREEQAQRRARVAFAYISCKGLLMHREEMSVMWVWLCSG